jgi:hypothetical protein
MRETQSLGKLRRSKLKSCSPAQTDINTDYCCTSSIAKQRRPKIQTDRRSARCGSYARDAAPRRSNTKKSCSPRKQTSTRLFAALAQSRSSADPKSDRREQSGVDYRCARRTTGKSACSKLKKSCSPAQTSTQIIRCTSSIAKQRPKFRLIGAMLCGRRGHWEAPPKLKIMRSPVTSTQIIRCTSSPRSSADPKFRPSA